MRYLTHADIAACCQLSSAAGWNQTPADWERMLQLDPLGCFCIETDARIVATTTLLTYGRHLAWIGMVLTDAAYQRRGYARQLVTAALELASARGIPCVKLDATDQGRPLYQSLGFEDEQPIERWRGQPEGVVSSGADWGPSPLYQLDYKAFGTDRSRFLNTLGKSMIAGGAFAMCRGGERANYLGPCTAVDQASAARVIKATLATKPSEPWFWDILRANDAARALAATLGFEPFRHLTRMSWGQTFRGDEHMIYAIAGFEAG